MLIPFAECVQILHKFNKKVTGILHVGAHECEELEAYEKEGVHRDNIAWIDAMKDKVVENTAKGIPHVFHRCILDTETTVPFYKTNNGQSSSVLEFGVHAINHPHVVVVGQETVETTTLRRFFEENPQFQTANFWNLDIQGVELRALRSAGDYIKNVDAIYTEVNTDEVYAGCDKMDEISEYLAPFGFKCVRQQIYKEYGWGDALYVRLN